MICMKCIVQKSMRKMTCEVYLSTHNVGYSGSLSTVNETNCQQKRSLETAHFQFRSDLSHHDVLEEGCHLLYCSGEMGSSTCSPDSQWRRFLRETAARKSDRSFIGPFFSGRLDVPSFIRSTFSDLNNSGEQHVVLFSFWRRFAQARCASFTSETQRLRIKLVLYCPICALNLKFKRANFCRK